jgi:hypothetical protein
MGSEATFWRNSGQTEQNENWLKAELFPSRWGQ